MRIATLLLAVIAAALAATHAAADDARPNILFMVADDLGWRDLGCFGSTFYETPNLDRLAAGGMKFTSAYAACQVCSPTRAALLSGQYPPRTSVTDYIGAAGPEKWNRNTRLLPAPYATHLPLENITLAESLKHAGYATFFCGKWHLGGEGFLPTDQGFDENIAGGHNGGPYGKGRYFHPFELPNIESKPGDHLPARLAEESVKRMKRAHAAGKPFLLYHAFYSVHTPLMARADLKSKYQAKAAALTPTRTPWVPEGGRQARQVQDHAVYAGMIEAMDQAAGAMLTALEEMGIAQNTIVIFTSDNGGLSTSEGSPTSNVPARGGKGWIYEGGLRVPLIVRWPGVTWPGSTSDEPVISMDFYPTLLQAAGIAPPPGYRLDGVSLAPALKGGELPQRDVFWHYPHYGNQGGRPSGAVRSGPWKLIEWYDTGELELYNLAADLPERDNRASSEPQRVGDLHARLRNWRADVHAVMPTRNPRFDSSRPEYK